MIVLYDPEKCDWDEVLEKAQSSRPPNDGMLVAVPTGGRFHRELLKKPHHYARMQWRQATEDEREGPHRR
jgi:hypothetical protein